MMNDETGADAFYSQSNATANELATSAQPTVQQQQRVQNSVLQTQQHHHGPPQYYHHLQQD